MKRRLFGLALALLTFSTLSSPSLADGGNVVLGGHCAVAYVAAQKPVMGDPKFTSEHGGRKYYFSSEGAKKMFDADPSKFAAALKYDGYCATALAAGKKVEGDPEILSVVDGHVYFFSSEAAKKVFDGDSSGMIKKAEASWKKVGKSAK